MSVIIAILIFCLLVIVHEFGHFYAAKKNGVMVEEFAIGMGPKIFGVVKDETLYSIRLLPIGGYCKMLGEDVESGDNRAFVNKKLYQRMIIVLAGVIMNFVLAFVLQFVLTSIDAVAFPIVSEVTVGSPAEEVGLDKGDIIKKYNGKNIKIFQDVSYAIMEAGDGTTEIVFKKPSGEIITKNITPKYIEAEQRHIIGFSASTKAGALLKYTASTPEQREMFESIEQISFSEYITYSVNKVFLNTKIVFYGLKMMVQGQVKKDDMMGVVGLVDVIDDQYTESIKDGVFQMVRSMLDLTILLSANLGVMNLLPIPAVDGGRFLFLIIEALRGKPVDPNKEGLFHLVGLALLMLFAAFIAFNDIMRVLGK